MGETTEDKASEDLIMLDWISSRYGIKKNFFAEALDKKPGAFDYMRVRGLYPREEEILENAFRELGAKIGDFQFSGKTTNEDFEKLLKDCYLRKRHFVDQLGFKTFNTFVYKLKNQTFSPAHIKTINIMLNETSSFLLSFSFENTHKKVA